MKKALFIALIAFTAFQSSAFATGWTQRWQQSSTEIWNGEEVGFFDEMAIWATVGSGTVFQDPAFSDYSTSGWTAYNESGDASARAFSCSALLYTQFDMNYDTNLGDADFLYMCAYQGEVRQRQHITYDSVTGWDYPAFEGTDAEWYALGGGEPIPEPLTITIFGSALLLLLVPSRKVPPHHIK